MPEPHRNQAYLALGSNIEAERNLPRAVHLLRRYGRLAGVSSVWQSAPVGETDQPDFLNAAVLLETPLGCRDLQERVVVSIERELGRVREAGRPNGPRTIDVDIVLFNNVSLRIDHRRIPDPQIPERPFLAVPLAEIAPEYVHPLSGETLREIAERLSANNGSLRRRTDVVLENVPRR